MVACYRKLNGWTDAAIITEYVVSGSTLCSPPPPSTSDLLSRRYRKFAGDKFRPLDEAFIASFNAEVARQILDGVDIPYIPLQTTPIQRLDGVDIPYIPLQTTPIQRRLGSPPPFPWSNQAEAFRLATEDSTDSLPTPPPSDKSEKGYDDDSWPPPGVPSPEPW